MQKTCYSLLICFVLSALTGCEGFRVAEGVVLDQTTKIPLEGVLYEVVGISEKRYTDSTGVFAVHGKFGGCIPDCLDIEVRLSKKGYKTVQTKNPVDSVFYLTRKDR